MLNNKKIFGIGVAKTGTSSLRFALESLGFNHKSWDKELNEKWNEGDYEPIFHEMA